MRRLDSLLLAGVGVLVVHQLAYAVSTIAGYEADVSHGHLAFAWLLSSLAALASLARAITRSLKRRSHELRRVGSLAGSIAIGYFVLEAAERWLDGQGLFPLFTEPVFWLGLLAAPLVALTLAWSLRSVELLVIVVSAAVPRIQGSSVDPSSLLATSILLPNHTSLSSVVSRRGPPAVLRA